MAQLDEYQLATKDAIDIVRTAVRLKHRIAQRRELNEIEPVILQQLTDAANAGKEFTLPVAGILGEAVDEATA